MGGWVGGWVGFLQAGVGDEEREEGEEEEPIAFDGGWDVWEGTGRWVGGSVSLSCH